MYGNVVIIVDKGGTAPTAGHNRNGLLFPDFETGNLKRLFPGLHSGV